jgi:hypothetical protein
VSELAPRERDAYADVGRALRSSIGQALEIGEGLTRETRALLAIYHLTATYSRVSDQIYVAQLADIARIRGDVDDRHLRRALKLWHERGVIWWEPAATGKGRGQRRPSTVSLVAPERRPLLSLARETRPDPDRKPGQIRATNPARSGPPPEEALPEKVNRGEQTSALQNLNIEEWGAQLAARLEAKAAPVGTIGRLVELCTDADEHTPQVLESVYARLPADFVERARERLLDEQPRQPARYAVGIAKKELRKRGLA